MPAPEGVRLYRSYLQHLRLLPDPHVWSVLQPTFKKLVRRVGVGARHAESSKNALVREQEGLGREQGQGTSKEEKALRKARKLLNRLRAAVASHPHALSRLLEETYGQRGSVRWDILRSISATSSSSSSSSLTAGPHHPLPPALRPLALPPIPPDASAQPRARKVTPACVLRAQERKALERDWKLVKVPLVLPPATLSLHDRGRGAEEGKGKEKEKEKEKEAIDAVGPKTGWEGKAVVWNLRLLAGLEPGPPSPTSTQSPKSTFTLSPSSSSSSSSSASSRPEHRLDLSSLPTSIRRIVPSLHAHPHSHAPTRRTRHTPYPPPPPRHTRQNPRTWGVPHALTPRVLRRAYRRLWDSLSWVRPIVPSSSNGVGGEGSEGKVIWEKCTFVQVQDLIFADGQDGTGMGADAGRGRGEERSRPIRSVRGVGWSRATEEEMTWIQNIGLERTSQKATGR